MDITEIEQLLEIFRDAKISELTVSAGDPQATIRLKKPLQTATALRAESKLKKSASLTSQPGPAAQDSAEFYIEAPMVGIFHSIGSIGAVGSSVKAGQVVGTIESMKLMNDIIADRDGTIVEMLIEDGMPVEYGHKLFRLE